MRSEEDWKLGEKLLACGAGTKFLAMIFTPLYSILLKPSTLNPKPYTLNPTP